MRKLLAIGMAMGATACARNGVLEVDVTSAELRDGSVMGLVLAVHEQPEWPSDPGAIVFDGTTGTHTTFAVVSERFDASLYLLAATCPRSPCPDPASAPHVIYRLPRAFHLGRTTRWSVTLRASSTSREVCVDPCEIRACIPEEGAGWFCRDDGSHFCDEPGVAPVASCEVP